MNEKHTAKLNIELGKPLHSQLREAIRRDIVSGRWNVGDQVPSDREISRIYGVSRITARRALTDLETQHMLVKRQGKGTFVCDWQSGRGIANVIGVGLYEPGYMLIPAVATIVAGLADAAVQFGFSVNVIVTGGGCEEHERPLYNRMAEQKRFDGLILLDHAVTDVDIMSVQDRGVPVVLFDRSAPDREVSSVRLDNRGGVFQLVEHLYEVGHRDIGLVVHDISSGHGPSRERYEGFRSAIDVLGAECHPEWIVQYSEDPGSGLSDLLNAEQRPTALVCADDLTAIRVMDLLRRSGYRVPEDISVVGFDNIPGAAHCVPPLTTIDPDYLGLGREMARLLIAQIRHESVPDGTLAVHGELVIRESVVPVGGVTDARRVEGMAVEQPWCGGPGRADRGPLSGTEKTENITYSTGSLSTEDKE